MVFVLRIMLCIKAIPHTVHEIRFYITYGILEPELFPEFIHYAAATAMGLEALFITILCVGFAGRIVALLLLGTLLYHLTFEGLPLFGTIFYFFGIGMQPIGSAETWVFFLIVLLIISIKGSGAFSIDSMLDKKRRDRKSKEYPVQHP